MATIFTKHFEATSYPEGCDFMYGKSYRASEVSGSTLVSGLQPDAVAAFINMASGKVKRVPVDPTDGNVVFKEAVGDTTTLVVIDNDRNDVYVGTVDKSAVVREHNTDTDDNSAVFAALFFYAGIGSTEASENWTRATEMAKEITNKTFDFDDHGTDFANAVSMLYDNLQYRWVKERSLPLYRNPRGQFKRATADHVAKYLSPSKTSSVEFVSSKKRDDSVYDLHSDIPDEVKEYLVELPDWYRKTKELYQIAADIKFSSDTDRPIRNIYLTGEAGTGKSMTRLGLADLHKIGSFVVTFNEDSDTDTCFGSWVPCEDSAKDLLGGIEDDDLIFNAASVADRIGAKSESITDILDRMLDMRSQYRYVESDMVKAYRYGGVCELQEVNIVRKPGVLVGLNNMLEINSTITLPTGEVVHRHPNCIFLLTSNETYAGCRPLNQSVLSRMQARYRYELPERKELVSRIAKASGLSETKKQEKKVIGQVLDMIKEIREFLANNEITDGVCGYREAEAWAQLIAVRAKANDINFETCGDAVIRELLQSTGEIAVLNKVSQDPASVEDVRAGIWGTKFGL